MCPYGALKTAFACIVIPTFLRAQKSAPDGLSKQCRPLLADVCERFADPSSFDRVLSCTREVDDVRGILHGTLNQMLATTHNLEVLEDKTEELRDQGRTFQKCVDARLCYMFLAVQKLCYSSSDYSSGYSCGTGCSCGGLRGS